MNHHQEARTENVESAPQIESNILKFENQLSSQQEAEQGLQKLSQVARTQPELMYENIMQLEQVIADMQDDPKTQGRDNNLRVADLQTMTLAKKLG